MNEAGEFIFKHKHKGALLDANILLVYLVGTLGLSRLRAFERTSQYVDDYPLFQGLVDYFFPRLYTTPHVLTEVSNLGKKAGLGFYEVLQKAIQMFDEKACSSKEAAVNPHFSKIGLTDCALMRIAADGLLVLTTDLPLYLILRSKNIDAVNVTQLRPHFWNGQFNLQ
jgi:hypothetical protein